FLESQNTGEPDVESKMDRSECQFPAGGKAMQHCREGPLPALLLKNSPDIRIRLPCMDNERQPRRARRRNVASKADLLSVARTVVVVVVEPRFPDCDHPGVPRPLDQLLDRYIKFLMCIVRMRPDRAVDVRKSLRDLQQFVESAHTR